MKWKELPSQAQEDLIHWYNTSEPNGQDRRRLAELYSEGKFHAWNCPSCGERVYWGEPDDWNQFQGVCQADFTSYPGSSNVSPWLISRQCDSCRMSAPTLEDLMLVGEGAPSCWSEDEDD